MKRYLHHISILSLLAVVTIATSSCKGFFRDQFDEFVDSLFPTGPEHRNYISLNVTFSKYNWNERHFTSNRMYYSEQNYLSCYISEGYLYLQFTRRDIGSTEGGSIRLHFTIDINEPTLEANRRYYFEQVEGTDGKKYSKNIRASIKVQDSNYPEESPIYYKITDNGWIEFTELTFTDDGQIICSGYFEFRYRADDGTFIKVSNGEFRNCEASYYEH